MRGDLERITDDLEDLFAFFAEWISGRCRKDPTLWRERAQRRQAADFFYVMPGGGTFEGAAIDRIMFDLHGTNPAFRIRLRNVAVRHRVGDLVVVTFEEWQRGAIQSSSPDNARLSSAVLRDRGPADGFELLQLQETWLPAAQVARGAFDF